jgi:hypothetical protein
MKYLSLKDVRDVQNKRDKKEEAFDYILTWHTGIYTNVDASLYILFGFYEIPEFF